MITFQPAYNSYNPLCTRLRIRILKVGCNESHLISQKGRKYTRRRSFVTFAFKFACVITIILKYYKKNFHRYNNKYSRLTFANKWNLSNFTSVTRNIYICEYFFYFQSVRASKCQFCRMRAPSSSHIMLYYSDIIARRLCEYEKHQQKYFDCVWFRPRYEMRGSHNSQDPNKYALLLFVQTFETRCWQARFTSKVFITRFSVNRIKFRDIDWRDTRYRLNAQISLVSHTCDNPHFTCWIYYVVAGVCWWRFRALFNSGNSCNVNRAVFILSFDGTLLYWISRSVIFDPSNICPLKYWKILYEMCREGYTFSISYIMEP